MNRWIAGLLFATAVIISSPSHAQFGAIAYSPVDNIGATSYGSGSRMDAERWALLHCREAGGRECAVVIWEANTCAALTVGYDTWGSGGSPINLIRWPPALAYKVKEDALGRAVVNCNGNDPDQAKCRWKLWVCDYPTEGYEGSRHELANELPAGATVPQTGDPVTSRIIGRDR